MPATSPATPKRPRPRPPPTSRPSVVANVLKWTLLALVTSAALSRALTETWLWGYEGRWSNERKVRPLVALVNCLPSAATGSTAAVLVAQRRARASLAPRPASRLLASPDAFSLTRIPSLAQIRDALFPPTPLVLSEAQLALHDGSQPDKYPLYLAVDGDVYDISDGGMRNYGPGKPYSVFAGRDAIRGSFASSCAPLLVLS